VKVEYHKLVRDKIIDIIQTKGEIATYFSVENDLELIPLLFKKLQEEVGEAVSSRDDSELMFELADCLEVMYRIAEVKGISIPELEEIRLEKQRERGSFSRNIFLESVESQEC